MIRVSGALLGAGAEPPSTVIDTLKNSASEEIRKVAAEWIAETWQFIKADLISTSYFVVLVGGTICIILYVAGWEKGMKYLGIGFVAHILLRAILN